MKWSEVVALNEAFVPTCDIKAENNNYWKQFIPHKDFYELLNKTLEMYKNKQKAIWLQGTYGSGKTHATMVIKELFSQDLNKVKDYIEHSIKDPKLKAQLLNVKEELKTFPIILKGSYSITDSKTFGFAIQKEVNEALKKAKIEQRVKTSFDTILNHMEESPIFWEELIKNSELQFEYDGKLETIKEKLKQYDENILKLCEKELSKKSIFLGVNDIVKYLEDVSDIIKENGYSHLTLFWDEFTSVLETSNYNDIFMSLQNIAENIKYGNVFLFIISHRTINTDKVKEKDAKHIEDRFSVIKYQMEDVTTYHLLAHSLKKSVEYKKIKERYNEESFKEIIRHIDGDNLSISNIRNMLPLHPYSGLILSMISRQLMSSNRSIFEFLYAKDGFIKFFENQTDKLMDIGYLWDYFVKTFDENEKLHIYSIKYSQCKDRGVNERYLHILKSILLLNVINKVIGGDELNFTKTLKPNRENLEYIFRYTDYLEILDEALEYIDKNCIKKDIDGVFLVSSAILPEYEISQEIERLKSGSYKTILKIIDSQKNDIKSLISIDVLRATEIDIRGASLKDYDIRRFADKFQKDYTLKVILFLAIEPKEILSLKDTLLPISKEFNDIAFIVVENVFSLKSYNDYIAYIARSAVAKRHNHESESERNQKQAAKLLQNFIDSLRESRVYIYFNGEKNEDISMRAISDELKNISKRIFNASADVSSVNGYKLWQGQNPTKTIPQNVLKSNYRDELNTNITGQYKPLIGLIKERNDYVIDENFNIKSEYSEHFIAKIFNKIDEIIKKKKRDGDINLSKSLKVLTKEPYGFYSNPIFLFLLTIALKKYDGKLYEIGSGKRIEGMLLADKIVDIFKYFAGNSRSEVRVRFGTEIDEKFFKILQELFDLEDGIGIKQGLFKVKDWIKERKYPLWVVKYGIENENIKNIIDKLTIFVNAHDEDIKLDDRKEFVAIIEKNSLMMDLKLALDKDKFELYFEKFLKSFNNLDLLSKKEEIYEYIKSNIRANQDSDIPGWNEDKVKTLVYEWHTKLSQPPQPHPEDENESGGVVEEPKPVTITSNEIEQFKNKIRYLNLTMIVLENIEHDMELYRVLKKYIED